MHDELQSVMEGLHSAKNMGLRRLSAAKLAKLCARLEFRQHLRKSGSLLKILALIDDCTSDEVVGGGGCSGALSALIHVTPRTCVCPTRSLPSTPPVCCTFSAMSPCGYCPSPRPFVRCLSLEEEGVPADSPADSLADSLAPVELLLRLCDAHALSSAGADLAPQVGPGLVVVFKLSLEVDLA